MCIGSPFAIAFAPFLLSGFQRRQRPPPPLIRSPFFMKCLKKRRALLRIKINYQLWYALAKTLSERDAWALAMDKGLNMVTINASLIVGPGITYKSSGSTIAYLKGAAQMYEKVTLASVDIKFLADAHICAYEDPSAYGRYICFNQIVSNAEDAVNLAQSLRHLISFPNT